MAYTRICLPQIVCCLDDRLVISDFKLSTAPLTHVADALMLPVLWCQDSGRSLGRQSLTSHICNTDKIVSYNLIIHAYASDDEITLLIHTGKSHCIRFR